MSKTNSAITVDAALGGIYEIIGDIIQGCGAEDSSGLRRCIAGKLLQDPLIAAAPNLLIACKDFSDAMREDSQPSMLKLIEALQVTDAAIAKAETTD